MFSEFGINTFSGNGKKMDTFSDVHYVNPHYVHSYLRNGSIVKGYWRDGDGNTLVNRSTGYLASNPGPNITKSSLWRKK